MRSRVKRRSERGIESTAQQFGGPWTLLKTDIVASYLQFFVTALKHQSFELIYIDAFAGSGRFEFVSNDDRQAALFAPEAPTSHAGSAQRALELDPPFDEIIFIEKSAKNVRSLVTLIKGSGHTNATVQKGDANKELLTICDPTLWRNRRGVVFLDPFGMNVAWDTLVAIGRTKALDVWLLYPLQGVSRNLPMRADRLDETKRAAHRRQLGSDSWFDIFYAPRSTTGHDLFGEEIRPKILRSVTADEIERHYAKRLRSLFPYVSEPKRLTGRGGTSLFSLFFAVSNPTPSAVDLASRVTKYILKM
jgi:three-Cys-motif partner protein